jgi:hypothetical protein
VSDSPGVRRAWGWVAHLADGGTTPWRDWTQEGGPGGRVLPGAQQLEVLRRLNLAGRPGPALAGRVLRASAPGRGRPDLELAGAVDRLRFGPAPVDPADLPDDELLRVTAGLLAEDVVAAGPPAPRRVATRRPWRTRYRLVGDPVLADPARQELIARGRPPGGRGAVVLVLGTDLGTMLAHAWTARCFAAGAPPWREWLDGVTRRRRLPPPVDLAGVARTWRDRVGPQRVRVVLDPAALPGLVRVRRPLPGPAPLSADAVDLSRRVGQTLGLLVLPPQRQALLRGGLLPRLAELPGPPLVVPPAHTDWVHTRAVRVRDALLRAGYPVHGDPDSLLPVDRTGVPEPSDAGVLALALRLLLEKEE